jgi:hypothetical protein
METIPQKGASWIRRAFPGLPLCLCVGCLGLTGEAFHPGKLWLDDNGVHINAHGGGILYHEGTYYWFGEHKVAGERGNRAQVGVHCYTSTDLYRWKDAGIAFAVDPDDPTSEVTQGCILERPKVIYNKRTQQFVMWFHLEFIDAQPVPYATARSGVAVADQITGPYRFLHSLRANPGIWPLHFPDEAKNRFDRMDDFFFGSNPWEEKQRAVVEGGAVNAGFRAGQMSRDQTVFVDDDGTAYQIAASEHNGTLQIRELDAAYTGYTGRYIRIFPGRYHEAPAVFKRKGKYYIITSGCTGWRPNAARSAVADSLLGQWQELGNPCRGGPDEMATTFNSQSTHVLKVEGTAERYVFMADRWTPSNAIDGRYVWLPIEFEEDRPLMRWRDSWQLNDDFDYE